MLVRRIDGGSWQSLQSHPYDSEDALETIVSQMPGLMPDGTTRGTAVARQVALPPAGTADIVGISTDGEIVLVECKLRSNPEIRRTVVGQVLAYASALSNMSFPTFAEAFERASGASLGGALQTAAREHGSPLLDTDLASARATMEQNLASGRFTLVIAVDVITDELKAIVQFVNSHTIPDLQILAMELHHYTHGDTEILLPITYGQESVDLKESRSHQPTTEARLFSELARLCPSRQAVDAVRQIYDWSRDHDADFYWSPGKNAGVTANFLVGTERVYPWSCYASAKPYMSINFGYIVNKLPEEKLERFKDDLERIAGVPQILAGIRQSGFNKYPSLQLAPIFGQDGASDIMIGALGRLIGAE